jgi:multiple sugar transport system substrate-binding protein
MNRRDFLKAGAILGAGAAATAAYATLSPGGISNISTQTGISTTATTNAALQARLSDPNVPTEYKDFLRWLQSVSGKYKGTKVAINLQNEPDYRAVIRLDADFYSASGINSQYDPEPYILNLEKTRLAVQTSSPAIDVIDFDSLDIPTFKDYLIPPQVLADTYPGLTYPGFSLNDFEKTPMNLIGSYPPVLPDASTPPGQVFCFPFNTPLMIRFYRTDVYNALKLPQPVTWDDYYDQAQVIGGSSAIFGCVSQASITTPIFHEFYNHLYSFGGRLWEIDSNSITPTINDGKNVQALENFARFFPYTIRSSVTNTWEDCVAAMAHGQAANAITFEDFAVLIDDPLRSLVTGKMAYSVNPSGPVGSYSSYIGDGIGISKFSRNPQAAWLWLQWATATGTQMMLVADKQTRYVPSRKSATNSSFVQNLISTPAYDPVRISQQILSSGQIGFTVPFKGSSEAADVIAKSVFDAYTGVSSAQAALDSAQAQLVANKYSF